MGAVYEMIALPVCLHMIACAGGGLVTLHVNLLILMLYISAILHTVI